MIASSVYGTKLIEGFLLTPTGKQDQYERVGCFHAYGPMPLCAEEVNGETPTPQLGDPLENFDRILAGIPGNLLVP